MKYNPPPTVLLKWQHRLVIVEVVGNLILEVDRILPKSDSDVRLEVAERLRVQVPSDPREVCDLHRIAKELRNEACAIGNEVVRLPMLYKGILVLGIRLDAPVNQCNDHSVPPTS